MRLKRLGIDDKRQFITDNFEPKRKWIPVSERLPEKATWSGDRVLVYTEEGYTHTGLYEGEIAGEWFDKFNDSGYITHWMPLPKPPQAEKEK